MTEPTCGPRPWASNGLRVELIERAGARAQTFADPLDAAQTQGYGHRALEADDLDAAFALPSAAPGQPVSSPAPAVQPGARFAYRTVQSCSAGGGQRCGPADRLSRPNDPTPLARVTVAMESSRRHRRPHRRLFCVLTLTVIAVGDRCLDSLLSVPGGAAGLPRRRRVQRTFEVRGLDAERLALSPQFGFATSIAGNAITAEAQRANSRCSSAPPGTS
jgi:hypothetical protein